MSTSLFWIITFVVFIHIAASEHIKFEPRNTSSPSSVVTVTNTTVSEHIKFEPRTTSSPSSVVTTTNATATTSSWQGYVGAVIAVVFFGSNFVPIKKFETGDGMFFQWILCSAIWFAGFITNWVQGFPQFYALATLGGLLWGTGNICVVPVVKTIGLGLGVLIWGSFNLLSGWASGRFGWFGLTPEIPNNPTLNYISIGLAAVSALIWMFVKSHPNDPISLDDDDNDPQLTRYLTPDQEAIDKEELIVTRVSEDYPVSDGGVSEIAWEDKLTVTRRRIVGVVLSIFSGTLYGLSFTPVIYIKNNYQGASQRDIDYVFAHFNGIWATSTIYFVLYCIIKKNKPKVYPSVILPAIVSGGMWAVADIGWFIANNYLSEAVSFPIITTGPGIVASLWGIFVFKEVKGLRNYVIMGVAFTFTIAAGVLAGLSKS